MTRTGDKVVCADNDNNCENGKIEKGGIRQQAYIRTFSAFPFEVIELRGFYYNCTDRTYAELLECETGNIYDSSTESCQSGSEIVSRKTGARIPRSGKVAARKNEKVLARDITLGALYYGKTDAIKTSDNFWDPETRDKMQRKEDTPRTIDFEIFTSESLLDRKNKIDVSASLSVSFMAGLIEITGSANVLLDKRVSLEESQVTARWGKINRRISISSNMKDAKDNRDVCLKVGKDDGKDGSPTHIVNSIVQGFEGQLSFTKRRKRDEDQTYVSGSLSAAIRKIPTLSIKAQVNITVDEDQDSENNTLKISYVGDGSIGAISTYKDAVLQYKDLTEQSKDLYNNIAFDLEPIEDFCSAADLLLLKISASLVEKATEIYDSFEHTELYIETLVKTDIAAAKYPQLIGSKLNDLEDKFLKFKNQYIKQFSVLLPNLRGGGKEEAALLDLINEYEQSRFQMFTMQQYLGYRTKEIDTLSLYIQLNDLTRGNDHFALYSETDSDSNECAFLNNKYFVRLQVIAPEMNNLVDLFLAGGEDKEKNEEWIRLEKWVDEEKYIQLGSIRHSLFHRLFRNNLYIEKNRCYLVKISANDTVATEGVLTTRIQITSQGEVVVANYDLPPPPEMEKDIISENQTDRTSKTIIVKYQYQEWIATDFRVVAYGHNALETLVGRSREDEENVARTFYYAGKHGTTEDKGLLVPINQENNTATLRLEKLEPFKEYYMRVSVRSIIGLGDYKCWGPITVEGKFIRVDHS